MRLSLEIPKSMLERLSPLCDFDFALAHLVLADEAYATFYRTQSEKGRFVFLDNGTFEKGHPLTSGELVEAAKRIKASVVCAPDKLGHYKEGIEWFHELKGMLPAGYGIAACMVGASPAERADFFMRCGRHANTICFPFREPRLEWFLDLLEKIPSYTQWPPRVHLFGVNDLTELRQFRNRFESVGIPSRRISVDTSKPIKLGLALKRMNGEMLLRGGGPLEEPAKPPTESQWSAIHYNIAFLRKYL